MSLFENGAYRYRETYFVMFRAENRPTLERFRQALAPLGDRYQLANLSDDRGFFESATLLAPEDFAALDICFVGGEEVLEDGKGLIEEMKGTVSEPAEQAKLKRIEKCDGRFDVFHFEHLPEDEEEAAEEMLDPGALLTVLDALVGLCDGVAIDPQSGAIL